MKDMKWGNLKYSIPTLVLFVSPWLHRALYENFMLAVPGQTPEVVHSVVWGAEAIAFIATLMWAVSP